jgi:hypothetical protein
MFLGNQTLAKGAFVSIAKSTPIIIRHFQAFLTATPTSIFCKPQQSNFSVAPTHRSPRINIYSSRMSNHLAILGGLGSAPEFCSSKLLAFTGRD